MFEAAGAVMRLVYKIEVRRASVLWSGPFYTFVDNALRKFR